jgi:hypothetical protein
VGADHFILLREHRSCTASTHYVTESEAQRIALAAAQLGASVVDGPRPQTAREMGIERLRREDAA